ncbi:MAG TPA: hypothetical protein VLQ79_00735, partial [Myxococcaceae bacterium]|nr:hypothetical protein [Myxococcaceae bacterium]
VTGDGAPDVVLVTRTSDRLVLFVAEGPVSPVGRWWRVDLHRGTEAGELCMPASAARVQVEDDGVVSHALECDRERTGACPAPHGRALRVQTGSCPAVHVFFDGSDLRSWSGSIPSRPFAP